MASNDSHFLINPRDREDRDAPRATSEPVYSQSAAECGDFDYPPHLLTLVNNLMDSTFLDVFAGDGDAFDSMSLDRGPYHPSTASADGAQSMRGSDGIDLIQPGLNLGPMVEHQLPTQERDVNSTVGPQSCDVAPQKTFVCEWKGCNQKRPFRREAELVRHIRTIHVRPNSYGCPVDGCSGVFNRRENLKVHLEKKHRSGGST